MKTFEHCTSIYIPSCYPEAVQAAVRDAVALAGGASVSPVQGSYSDREGVLVQEGIQKVSFWYPLATDPKEVDTLVRRTLIRLLALGEESVLVEHDCEAILYFGEDLECL